MSARRPGTDRLLGIALGALMVLAALAVAVFVGRSGTSSSVALSGGGTRTVSVELADMRVTPSLISIPRGTRLVLDVRNSDQMSHDLYIDGGPGTPLLRPGQSARLDLGVVRRTVQGWCTVPGHKAAGMVMTIRVTGSAAAPSSGMGMAMRGGRANSPAIDFTAKPGPQWKPYEPSLQPLPPARTHRITFTIRDTRTEVAPGVYQTLWTYNGTAPGPILHGRVGDRFVVTLVNDGDMAHGVDFHAGAVAPDGPMRSIEPGQSLSYAFTARYSGAWLYHCSTMPMSLHIANGMYGAVIVDPPDLDHVAKQFVIVQSELYLGAQNGVADENKIDARQPDAVVFNGFVDQYVDAPISVRAGERIRVWVVDAGPQFGTSFHVVGTQFDTVFKEGAYLLRPDNPEHGAAQTLDLAPAQGGFVEFTLAAPGHYPFLDHAMVDAEHGAKGIFVAH
ncbi:MAG TPA: multicopper oxidase domain-containing protein [Jatrophihabitantaceae bacterium]|nr:multicopper oxidase domain-containing protein [Jatrophihabitantaceae bacterium]